MKDRSLSIRTTDTIFDNAILKCSQTVIFRILHAKCRNNKVLMAVESFQYVCEEREISSKTMSAIFREYLYLEGSIFANTITFFQEFEFQLTVHFSSFCRKYILSLRGCYLSDSEIKQNQHMLSSLVTNKFRAR